MKTLKMSRRKGRLKNPSFEGFFNEGIKTEV